MNYNEFLKIAKDKHLMIKGIAEELDMTTGGLQLSLQNDSIKAYTVRKLCKFLDITPNQFFGWKDTKEHEYTYNNIGGINATQTINEPTILSLLEKQLKEKDRQLLEKDMQIRELHKTINKLTLVLNK